MHELMKEYRQVQHVIVERLEGALPRHSAELMVLQMEQFASRLEDALALAQKGAEDVRDENALLRSLLGASEESVQAQLISAGEEIRFLRGQLASLNREFSRLQEQSERVSVQAEVHKQESEKAQLSQRLALQRFEAEAEIFNQRFFELQQRYSKLLIQKEAEKAAVAGTIPLIDTEVRHEVKDDLRQVGLKLRGICNAVVGSAQYCLERWDRVKEKRLSTRFSRLLGLDRIMRQATGTFDDLVADLAQIKKNAAEMVHTIDTYIGLLGDVVAEPALMDIRKVLDEARRRNRDAVRGRKLKVSWPNEKKYPVIHSDAKIVGDVMDCIIANAIESTPMEGTIDIRGVFSPEAMDLRISDSGLGVALADMGRLFRPFFTTKPGHAGLGLYRARRLAMVIGGSVKCERVENRTVFVIHIPHRPARGEAE